MSATHGRSLTAMDSGGHFWGLILAAGEGSRLRALTTQPCGTAVPKQYCSLHGGCSLLEEAMRRAEPLVKPDRLCVIVAQQHRRWWSTMQRLEGLPQRNLIVQPRNRGTAIGILYSLLHILGQDGDARVLLLPADHHVADEPLLRKSLSAALEIARNVEQPVLVGLQPEEPDTELGYILPGDALVDCNGRGGYSVTRFVEKPSRTEAAEITRAGGLWNTFIMAASARALLNLFLPRFASVVMEMQVVVGRAISAGAAAGWPATVEMYGRLPDLDFSRDLLQGHESGLRVVQAPPCGWSDLGTPGRVGQALQRLRPELRPASTWQESAGICLAAQHARLESAMRSGAV